MVVICGVDVSQKSLPYVKAIEYVVKPRDIDVRMLQKTKILQQCTEIYSTFEMVDYIPSNCRSKTFLIKDAEELIEKLMGQPQSDYMEQLNAENTPLLEKTNAVQESSISEAACDSNVAESSSSDEVFDIGTDDFEQLLQDKEDEIRHRDEIIEKLQSIIQENAEQSEAVQEVPMRDNTELLDRISELETILAEKDAIIADNEQRSAVNAQLENQTEETVNELNEQIQSLQMELTAKDAVIADKDTELSEKDNSLTESQRTVARLNEQIAALTADNEDMSKLSAQLDTVIYDCSMYQADCEKYQAEIQKLNEQIKSERKLYEQDKAEYEQALNQYETEQQTSAIVTMLNPYLHGNTNKTVPCFTMAEIKRLKLLNFENISLVCFGSGASISAGLRGVQNVLNKGEELLLVDCTGDAWLPSVLKLERKAGVLLNQGGNIADMVIKRGRSEIIRTNAFDDIQLFTFDWISFLEKLVTYANGKKTIMMLGSIRSFAVKHTMLKLAQVLSTTVVVKAEPHSAQSLYWDLLNIPSDRISLGVIEYTPIVKQIFDSFITKYNVQLTKSNDISEVIYRK